MQPINLLCIDRLNSSSLWLIINNNSIAYNWVVPLYCCCEQMELINFTLIEDILSWVIMNNAMGKENERQIPFQMFQMLDFAYNWVANVAININLTFVSKQLLMLEISWKQSYRSAANWVKIPLVKYDFFVYGRLQNWLRFCLEIILKKVKICNCLEMPSYIFYENIFIV